MPQCGSEVLHQDMRGVHGDADLTVFVLIPCADCVDFGISVFKPRLSETQIASGSCIHAGMSR